MRRFNVLLVMLTLLVSFNLVFAQVLDRKKYEVPSVVPGTIKIDGKGDEAAWNNALKINILTTSGYDGFFNKYWSIGDALNEPDYKSIYGRVLWSQDTLYLFYHVQEVVNDSMKLTFLGKFGADQIMIGLSNRLGIDMNGWYDGNVYAAPDGPYYYWVIGNQVSLNGGDSTSYAWNYQRFPGDTLKQVFDAQKYARWGITIDTTKGIWDVEMAIYNPGINAQSSIAFNIGGSNGGPKLMDPNGGDHTYSYYCWQPNIPNNPYGDPEGSGDPGQYTLKTSRLWPILTFKAAVIDSIPVRKVYEVPMADSGSIKIDGKMDEAMWTKAQKANILTTSGYDGFFNKYWSIGDALKEPDYKSIYGRMLWAKDTLYLFYHVQEVVNDSMKLTFMGKFEADQIFVCLSNRLGLNMNGWYDGNVYAAPDGPYYYWVIGDKVTLNGGDSTQTAWNYRTWEGDTLKKVFDAKNYARWATSIDTTKGIWDLEMAIYNPNIDIQSSIGFNLGGSNGGPKLMDPNGGDHTYSYYCWQPNLPNNPYGDPVGSGDPGQYVLKTATYWPIINFVSKLTGVETDRTGNIVPEQYELGQNYPNPFNPSTTIQFSVPKMGNVTLKVYNIVGQVVATLINGQNMTPGKYAVTWDAKTLASGVYFYSLEANGMSLTKKMMLLK